MKSIRRALQVVVHNLPWTCSWQQLKDAFVEAGVANIERADVIIDSSGRSRWVCHLCFPRCSDQMLCMRTHISTLAACPGLASCAQCPGRCTGH